MAKGQEHFIVHILLREVLLGERKLLRRWSAVVVALQSRYVGKNPAAVDALPPEQAGGKGIPGLPVELVRVERIQPTANQNLRQAAGVPEDVGQPTRGGPGCELTPEELDTMEDLADQ